MADSENILDLDEVKGQFLQAEATLKGLAGEMSSVKQASSQLSDAQTSVSGAAKKIGELASELSTMSGALRQAIDVITDSDPAVVIGKLQGLDGRASSLEEVAKSNRESLTKLEVQAQKDRQAHVDVAALNQERMKQLELQAQENHEAHENGMSALAEATDSRFKSSKQLVSIVLVVSILSLAASVYNIIR